MMSAFTVGKYMKQLSNCFFTTFEWCSAQKPSKQCLYAYLLRKFEENITQNPIDYTFNFNKEHCFYSGSTTDCKMKYLANIRRDAFWSHQNPSSFSETKAANDGKQLKSMNWNAYCQDNGTRNIFDCHARQNENTFDQKLQSEMSFNCGQVAF